jgi:hypothetical protein
MSQVRIAMPGLFGSMFFLLLPIYDTLLHHNSINMHPLIQIIFIIVALLTILSAIITSKKLAYILHDIHLAAKKNEANIDNKIHFFTNTSFISTLILFIVWLFIKYAVFHNKMFFLQSLFGLLPSLVLSVTFLAICIWSSFVLIKAHLDQKHPNTFVSFCGKQVRLL